MANLSLHPDRLFPAAKELRPIAQRLYAEIVDLPIISPHGHTDPRWFADNEKFSNATELLLTPDHYLFRMLHSQGVDLTKLGVPLADGSVTACDPRAAWRLFAEHWYLFAGTPSRMWLDWVFVNVFGLDKILSPETADEIFDAINSQLATPEFLPRALFERFNIEVLTTTESPLDPLLQHQAIRDSGWKGRVLTAYRPDPTVDPEFAGFRDNVAELGELTGEDTSTWRGYLRAHRVRREFFKSMGATSTDHGHPTCCTANLSQGDAQSLFSRVTSATPNSNDAELFRAQMLTEMAAMSIDDGLVMQIHPGSFRNHSSEMLRTFGRDKGFDIPTRTDYVHALKPLLDSFGLDKRLSIIVFTLDESSYSRELAPLAGVYPTLKLGPSWWFHDSPEGMRRFRKMTTETAGFYNTVGFNDDTRAFLSIPARHDVARRIDCAFLSELVADHRLGEEEATGIAKQLAYELPKRAYKLDTA
ncbi:MAG: glucuronate isomerase [Gammaproteobacteria bacterium]|nr:glucuronate isomerase [Gammaproteobacteria bacterium]MDH5239261.1 glucuronate isomerase [Gammaproteobacteria bacterium]MDH5259997.1 glucuronate isomerase [Gammaproteobacteria bacterium]MDH5620486.1 glucuronate isomerase [Gammaproteobacteria bacterium]